MGIQPMSLKLPGLNVMVDQKGSKVDKGKGKEKL
jgi:hypothetical protein